MCRYFLYTLEGELAAMKITVKYVFPSVRKNHEQRNVTFETNYE